MAKITKKQAGYKSGSSMKRCAFCSMMRLPDGCSLVEGRISLAGVCKFWENMLTGKGKPNE